MVNGPPTPPPTTAIELQDEARAHPSSTQPTPSSSSAATAQDPYQHFFPMITDLAAQNKFHDLIQVAEQGDLNGDGDRQLSRLLITGPLVLAYLIVDDLAPARHALARLPDNLASHPLCKTLYGLVASAWERKHAAVYSRAEGLFNMVAQPDFIDAKLGSIIAEMVTTFTETFRTRTFALLSKSFTSLPLPLAQTYLGMPVEQLLAVTLKNNWSYEASSGILSPCPPPTQKSTIPAFSTLSTFNFVTDSVARLEL